MEVEQSYGDDVRFIGIPSLAGTDSFDEFVAETGTGGFTHIPDPDGVLWDRFGVTEHRTYVLINDDGVAETKGYGSLADDVSDLISR